MGIYIIYTIMFIIGTLLGSFFTLAIHRIPNGQNITYKRSYCPHCEHKLGFFDLIPIFSYITLNGKCKYCGEKISPKYIIIEILSGILVLLFTISLDINIYIISVSKIISLLLGIIYISTLFLIGGIDREKHNISKGILLFGLIIHTIYIVYLYMLNINIYRYVMYLFIMLILILIETIYLKKTGKEKYPIQILTLCVYIVMWIGEDLAILSIIATLLLVAIEQMIKKPKKEDVEKQKVIPIASWLCFSNIVFFIIESFIR